MTTTQSTNWSLDRSENNTKLVSGIASNDQISPSRTSYRHQGPGIACKDQVSPARTNWHVAHHGERHLLLHVVGRGVFYGNLHRLHNGNLNPLRHPDMDGVRLGDRHEYRLRDRYRKRLWDRDVDVFNLGLSFMMRRAAPPELWSSELPLGLWSETWVPVRRQGGGELAARVSVINISDNTCRRTRADIPAFITRHCLHTFLLPVPVSVPPSLILVHTQRNNRNIRLHGPVTCPTSYYTTKLTVHTAAFIPFSYRMAQVLCHLQRSCRMAQALC
uniref:Uncharacterized protein n=1 Tax=Timema bartmani TaxID=61472 RepID=A0A7R9HZ72_9NEOP|nr:unnamed protein product [Timema bartmani]